MLPRDYYHARLGLATVRISSIPEESRRDQEDCRTDVASPWGGNRQDTKGRIHSPIAEGFGSDRRGRSRGDACQRSAERRGSTFSTPSRHRIPGSCHLAYAELKTAEYLGADRREIDKRLDAFKRALPDPLTMNHNQYFRFISLSSEITKSGGTGVIGSGCRWRRGATCGVHTQCLLSPGRAQRKWHFRNRAAILQAFVRLRCLLPRSRTYSP